MALRTIAFVLECVCLAIVFVGTIHGMAVNKRLGRRYQEFKCELDRIKKNLSDAQIELAALGDACEEFYDEEYVPFVAAHELTSNE